MARPAHERIEGNPARLWARIEATRKAFGMTQAEMAAVMGITSGDYRATKASGLAPTVEAWARFVGWEALQSEGGLAGEVTECRVWDRGVMMWVHEALPYPRRVCANHRSRLNTHRTNFLPRVANQRFCCTECGRDYRKRRDSLPMAAD